MPERRSARRTRCGAGSSFVCAVAGLLLAASASLADVAAPGLVATLRWAPAAGPVSGYQVFVGRNGGEPVDVGVVATNQVTLSGGPGDVIEVAVRAWGLPAGPAAPFEWGPLSALSERIRFDGPPVVGEAYPLLDCASCRRFEQRDLAGSVLLAAPHPASGSWALVGVGALAAGGFHALLREASTGTLWVGNLSGAGLTPLASQLAPGFAESTVLPPVDLDGDGVAEIVVHHPPSGRIQIWNLVAGALVKRAEWLSPAGFTLVGAGDFDADRIPDLWLDTHHGMVWIDRLVDCARVGSTVLVTPMSQFNAVDVADYDGDSRADVLWRDETGALRISLVRGALNAPQAEVRELAGAPGDANVVPRASLDLDGRRGAEILLQDLGSGAVEIALPADAVPGRRQHLLDAAPAWRLAGMN